MVIVAQPVRALDCGSRGRGFEPHLSPKSLLKMSGLFYSIPAILILTKFKRVNNLIAFLSNKLTLQ